MMRIAPRRASQLKADTIGGAFDFQMVKIGLEYHNPSKRTEKKDATEKEPSADGAQTLLSCPSSGRTEKKDVYDIITLEVGRVAENSVLLARKFYWSNKGTYKNNYKIHQNPKNETT